MSNDTRDDPPAESFTVTLSTPAQGSLGPTTVHTVSIEDDDLPEITIGDAGAVEGQPLRFTVTASSTSATAMTAQCYTWALTATGGTDYTQITGSGTPVSIAAGTLSTEVTVATARDTAIDPDETLKLVCHTLTNAQWWDSEGLGTIFQPAAGDFNADGFSLLFQNAPIGEQVVWAMGGLSAAGSQTILPVVSDANWRIAGTPDFNRDGVADLLWRHETAGTLFAWEMPASGTTPYEPATTRLLNPSGISDLGWKVRGTGFFNADYVADIVLHHATQDYVALWLMQDEGAHKGTKVLDSVLTSPATVDADTWKIVGTGDFNGDGTSDLVWQEQTQGWLAVWLMDGATLLPNGSVSLSPNQVSDTNWKIVGVGDYNRDGKPDLVWRDTTTPGNGWIVVWLMNGTTLLQSISTTPDKVDLSLALVGPK